MCHYMRGETDAARAAFEQALKTGAAFAKKQEVERRLSLLVSEQAVGQLTKQQLEATVRLQPDDVLIHTALGDKYSSAGMAKEAAAEYQEVLKLNPKFVGAL